jgi:diketogulonate reductase-like aldo/keto reductase
VSGGGVTPVRVVRERSVPSFFYGTAWKEDRTEALTRLALGAGFRAIDTANQRRHYFEAAVGDAVAAAVEAGAVSRQDLFLQTKFTSPGGQDRRLPYDAGAGVPTQVQQSFESSLGHLRTSYVDSLVLHGPSSAYGLEEEDWQAWRAMEAVQRSGRARLIGVSNVTLEQLRRLHHDSEVRPAFVQNRCYARTGWDREVRAFCRAHDIAYQGFSLLTANAREIQQPAVAAIARRAGRTLPQVVFRFALQVGMIPLTGTSSEVHMREDLAAFDFELDDDEVRTIERCGG